MHTCTRKNHLYIPSYTFFDCHFKAGMYYFRKNIFENIVIFEFFENFLLYGNSYFNCIQLVNSMTELELSVVHGVAR